LDRTPNCLIGLASAAMDLPGWPIGARDAKRMFPDDP
jgi:hypothetical protein